MSCHGGKVQRKEAEGWWGEAMEREGVGGIGCGG